MEKKTKNMSPQDIQKYLDSILNGKTNIEVFQGVERQTVMQFVLVAKEHKNKVEAVKKLSTELDSLTKQMHELKGSVESMANLLIIAEDERRS